MLEVLEYLGNPKVALQELFRVYCKYVLISVPYESLWSILNILRGKYVKCLGNTLGYI